MAYNTETQEELMTRRLTARQAVPRGWNMPRNMQVVRHASPPSNDAGLDFESKYVAPAPPPPEEPGESPTPPGFPEIPATQWLTHAAADAWGSAYEAFTGLSLPTEWDDMTLAEKYATAKLLPYGVD